MRSPGPGEQSDDCTFCLIIAGRIDTSIVYEDAATLAFVDQRQPGWPRGGHILVVPKAHVEFLFELSDPLAAQLMQAVVRVSEAVRRVTEPGGISVWSSNGVAAGQEVPHVHLHVLARFEDDRVLRVYEDSPERPERSELAELASRVRESLGSGFGTAVDG